MVLLLLPHGEHHCILCRPQSSKSGCYRRMVAAVDDGDVFPCISLMPNFCSTPHYCTSIPRNHCTRALPATTATSGEDSMSSSSSSSSTTKPFAINVRFKVRCGNGSCIGRFTTPFQVLSNSLLWLLLTSHHHFSLAVVWKFQNTVGQTWMSWWFFKSDEK